MENITIMRWFTVASLVLSVGSLGAAHIHFMHQSTGGNWLADWSSDPDWGGGNLRADLEAAGNVVTDEWVSGSNAPYTDWDPENDGLCHFFLNNGAALSDDARAAEILIIKSCFYPTLDLENDGVLNNWKNYSSTDIVQGYYNNHPEKKLIFSSTVPHHRSSGDLPSADKRARARDWGEWLANRTSGLGSYSTHKNVWGFDAFTLTARQETEPNPNTLKAQYEISSVDDHMNRQGNIDCSAGIRALINEMAAIEEGKVRFNDCFLKISPNPGKGMVSISYQLLADGQTTINIYDVTGTSVSVLVNGQKMKGREHMAIWNGTNNQGMKVPAGIYFCRLTAKTYQITQKLVLVK